MLQDMRKKIDKLWIGSVLGLLVPALSLWIYVLLRFDELAFGDFIKTWFKMGILTHMISLAVLPNLAVFFIFIKTNYLKAARGVLLSTILFAFTVLIIRFS